MAEQTSSSSLCFYCTVAGDHVQCHDTKLQQHYSIQTEDILCIYPSSERACTHSMLFLQKDTGSSDAPPKLARVYIKNVPSTLLSSHLITEMPNHLCNPSDNHTRVHVIISTASGMGTAKSIYSRILKKLFFYTGLTQYEVHETRSAQTITELCRSLFIPQAEAGIQQTIVLLSGDGGLCDIIDAFYSASKEILTTPDVALIPAGTGNAMASSIGLLAQPTAALTALLRGKPTPVPVFVAKFSHGARTIENGQIRNTGAAEPSLTIYGGVVASWGIHAALVADSDTAAYRKFGADRFKMAAKELLFPSDGSSTHKYSGTITLFKKDNQRNIEREKVLQPKDHMYVLATLVSKLEKDFMISPESKALDGSLRMVRFGPMPPQQAMQVISSAYEHGRHVQDDNVMYSEIEGYRIDFHEADERWRRVCIDGRVVVVKDGSWMQVHKEKRKLVNILFSEF
ncbi:ATP-NAD kinase-like domain-containing protein [Aspergillus egyptiacus]|nr:ATP-NAD kinase-like domain-containing protein [Aspergillus egyptiacus]